MKLEKTIEQTHREICSIAIRFAKGGAPKDVVSWWQGNMAGLRHAAKITGLNTKPMELSAHRVLLVCRKYEQNAFQKLALPEMRQERKSGSDLSN